MRNICSLLLFIFLSMSILTAQVQKIRINTITIEGNETSDAGMIRLNTGLTAGSEITGEDIQKAVKNLWALNIFSDVQVYVTNQSYQGLDLLIKVKEYPRLNDMVIKGYDELSQKEVEEELDTYRGMRVTPFKISRMKKKLLKKYRDEGFLLADVAFDTVSAGKNRVNLEVNIQEGVEVQVEKITFHGNENFDDDDLKGAMDEVKEDRWWRSADFNPKKFEEDKQKIVQFYKENGYRDAEVIRDSISYSEDHSDLYIDIWVAEGNKYYFGDISFEGNVIFTAEELQANLDIEKGDLYDQKKYDEGVRDRLQKMYYNQGYLFAQIQPREVPRSQDTLDISFSIREGNVVRIKEIIINGNDKTNEKVIRREFKIHPGDIFNSAKLERSIRDVTILNYFAYANPDVRIIENDMQNVNLILDVEEKSTDMANMSAGYSQRDGLIGSVGLTFNNFSLTHPFSGGDGQRLVCDWQFGSYYRSISLSFTEPWLLDTPTLGGFSIFSTRQGGSSNYYYPWKRLDTGGTLRIGRRFYWPDNYFRGDWIFRYAQTTIEDIDDQELYYYGREGKTVQVSLTQIISRDSRNNAEFPTWGSTVTLSTELSGGLFGGDQHFFKTIFGADFYMPLPFGLVLYSNNKYGYVESIRKNSYILYGEYFYIGGSGLGFAEGLRGYDDGQVGPLTSSGSPIGGKTMVKNGLELRFPIAPNPTIFGLLFAEGGNAWIDVGQTNPFDLRRSAGAGIRLFMPMIGIIGIDFGYGFDYYDALGNRSGDWKIHFQFGRF
ncbi:MAG: outer membrane protein assembly factor BamA [Calditrichaceae bacterium]|nr:outer membrane protein assembly factor BamA [Calditrichaceae bacterium]RQV97624.1 MAG: outer membrane protein assembly factor BamA [Calditrichota bacterium]